MSDKTCQTCLLRSKKDKCCTLTGKTVSKTETCSEHSDGKVVERKPRMIHIDARPDHMKKAERALGVAWDEHQKCRY